MPPQMIAIKLLVPPLRPHAVARAGLTARLEAGLSRKLTLRSDESPKQISFVVAGADGERLYHELQRHFPAAISGWQG